MAPLSRGGGYLESKVFCAKHKLESVPPLDVTTAGCAARERTPGPEREPQAIAARRHGTGVTHISGHGFSSRRSRRLLPSTPSRLSSIES